MANLSKTSEIISSLASYFKSNFKNVFKYPLRLGVCVSGGPDSMALAYTLKRLGASKPSNLDFECFIIDHGARTGSSDEAIKVADNLSRIGMHSRILKMTWPANQIPLEISRFESEAREKRFRLLGRAALEQNIHHLFLGHHQDDQIETVLMRLQQSNRPSWLNLQGIAHQAPFPLGSDVYGVRNNKTSVSASQIVPNSVEATRELGIDARVSSFDGRSTLICSLEDRIRFAGAGGLRLHRPLLPFVKSDLIQVCEDNNVLFVVDKSNFMPTLTTRNAIRYLRSNYQLPTALSSQSILNLRHSAVRMKERYEEESGKILNDISILSFDMRSGCMVLCLPDQLYSAYKQRQYALARVLAKVVNLVSPVNLVDLPISVSPGLIDYLFLQEDKDTPRPSRNENGVLWQKYNESSIRKKGQTWILSRQPLSTNDKAKLELPFVATSSSAKHGWSDYLLWDNRYWIKIFTGNHLNFGIRPYTTEDRIAIKHRLPRREFRDLEKSFNAAAPGSIRTTLPVLTYKNQVCALPTFGVLVQLPQEDNVLTDLEWRVRYKSPEQTLWQPLCEDSTRTCLGGCSIF